MDRDVLRQVAVVSGVVGGLVSGATGDYGEAADSPSRVLPADWAFGIWFPVYAGSLAYAAETARPSRRRDPLLRRTGWPAATAYALAGTWVRLRPRQQVPVIAATLAAAALAHSRAATADGDDRDRWTVQRPLGLFTGWVTLATAAASTEVLLAEGVEVPGAVADACGVGVLGLAGGIATAVTRRVPGSRGYPAAVVWGLLGTAVRTLPRWRAPGVAALAGASAVAAAAAAAPRGRR